MRRIKTILSVLAAVLLAACNGIEKPYEGTFDQVLIYYGMGYNNLSANLKNNLEQLSTDVLPGLSYDKAIVAFTHNVAVSGNYVKPHAPVLVRMYRGSDGLPVTDTLKVYDDMTLSASGESIRRVLDDVRAAFPAQHYGLIVSSHGTGWIPGGYAYDTERTFRMAASRDGRPDYRPEERSRWPETKAIGNQYQGGSNHVTWVELKDFAQAIPMHLDYLILDTCLSGCVEVAYEFKDVCDYLVISPTEILTSGMVYTTLSWDMFAGAKPDLLTYCDEYYRYYNEADAARRAGTITLVDCAKLNALASVFGGIVDAHRDALADKTLHSTVQRYYYSSSPFRFYYDLRDLCLQIGASEAELSKLDAALAEAVPYHAETPAFFDLLLERCCGLSVYIPEPGRPLLNEFYRSLAWNRATGLVE